MKKFLFGLAGAASLACLLGFRMPADALEKVNLFSSYLPPANTRPDSEMYPSNPVNDAMNSLWNGQSYFQVIESTQIKTHSDHGDFVAGINEGTQIVPINGTWYLFSREFYYTNPYPNCPWIARIVVRSSTDHGRHWSDESVLAEPNQAAGECGLVDGHAYWDTETNTWQYLAQVLEKDNLWNFDHFTLKNPNPMQRFNSDSHNPVVREYQLWNNICGHGKSCPMGTFGEGTPQFSMKKSGFFYITFSGAYRVSGSNLIYGVRGMAKTADFHTWITNDSDLPNDAIWSSRDCRGWNVPWDSGGCVGGGWGSSLVAGDTYIFMESFDLSESCTDGQHWVAGMARSSGFVPSGRWQQMSGNPILNTDLTRACAIQYQDLFVDGNTVYMSYWKLGPQGHDFNRLTWFHVAQLMTPETLQPFVLDANQGLNVGDLHLIMQTDTNLVLYSRSSGQALWASGTYQGANSCQPHTGCFADFQNDGNLVIYKGGRAIWSSGTWNCGTTMRMSSTSWPYMTVEGRATCPITRGYPQ